MIKIENRTNQGDDREDDNDASYHLINNKDAIGIKLATYLVNKPCETEPPQQSTEHNAEIAHSHLQRHIRHHKGKLRECSHEEEHDERIRQRDKESRHAIVEQRALLVAALVHILGRITLKAINAKNQQEQTAKDLQVELVLSIVDEVHHETHAQTCEQGINYVAASCTDTSHETIPTPLVQSALDT